MLTITNGRDTLIVTKGAYSALYKHQGYSVLEGDAGSTPSPNTQPDANSPQPEIVSNDDYVEGDNYPDEGDKTDFTPENSGDSDTESGEDEGVTDLSEIPLIEMSKEQLYEYADQLGIEYTGEETKKQLRALIRESI